MALKTSIKIRVAKKRGEKTTPELHFNFGDGLTESCAWFGSEAIHTLFVSAARQQLSEWARKELTRKKNPATLQQLQDALDAGDWKPSVKQRGKSALDKAASFLEAMSPEDRAKLAEIAKTFAPKNGSPADSRMGTGPTAVPTVTAKIGNPA